MVPQVTLQTMMGSRFIMGVKEEVRDTLFGVFAVCNVV